MSQLGYFSGGKLSVLLMSRALSIKRCSGQEVRITCVAGWSYLLYSSSTRNRWKFYYNYYTVTWETACSIHQEKLIHENPVLTWTWWSTQTQNGSTWQHVGRSDINLFQLFCLHIREYCEILVSFFTSRIYCNSQHDALMGSELWWILLGGKHFPQFSDLEKSQFLTLVDVRICGLVFYGLVLKVSWNVNQPNGEMSHYGFGDIGKKSINGVVL